MPESESWAIATQQSHAVGKSPKGYGTAEGRQKAKEKYDTPGDDKKTADPKTKEASLIGYPLNPVMLEAFTDEMKKIAGIGDWVTSRVGRVVGKGLKSDPVARKELSEAVSKGLGEKVMAAPHRLAELLKGGKEVATLGPEKLVQQPKFLGLFPRKPKMMPTIENIRPGNKAGVYSGKTQSVVPHEAQDEALKSLLARGAVGGAGLYGAGKLVGKAKKSLSMPPEGQDPYAYYKQANLGAMMGTAPANPTGLTEVKSTIPNKPLSGKTPKYSKVISAPTPTTAASHQPVSAAPQVRA